MLSRRCHGGTKPDATPPRPIFDHDGDLYPGLIRRDPGGTRQAQRAARRMTAAVLRSCMIAKGAILIDEKWLLTWVDDTGFEPVTSSVSSMIWAADGWRACLGSIRLYSSLGGWSGPLLSNGNALAAFLLPPGRGSFFNPCLAKIASRVGRCRSPSPTSIATRPVPLFVAPRVPAWLYAWLYSATSGGRPGHATALQNRCRLSADVGLSR
jgi:hypothetical protein